MSGGNITEMHGIARRLVLHGLASISTCACWHIYSEGEVKNEHRCFEIGLKSYFLNNLSPIRLGDGSNKSSSSYDHVKITKQCTMCRSTRTTNSRYLYNDPCTVARDRLFPRGKTPFSRHIWCFHENGVRPDPWGLSAPFSKFYGLSTPCWILPSCTCNNGSRHGLHAHKHQAFTLSWRLFAQ